MFIDCFFQHFSLLSKNNLYLKCNQAIVTDKIDKKECEEIHILTPLVHLGESSVADSGNISVLPCLRCVFGNEQTR